MYEIVLIAMFLTVVFLLIKDFNDTQKELCDFYKQELQEYEDLYKTSIERIGNIYFQNLEEITKEIK